MSSLRYFFKNFSESFSIFNQIQIILSADLQMHWQHGHVLHVGIIFQQSDHLLPMIHGSKHTVHSPFYSKTVNILISNVLVAFN